MERIENLLKREMGTAFDTRKTLNRSDKKVPDDILAQIESGVFTCEMIDELSNQFPIFRYQTQITIHGEFDVKRSSIGQYTNIFQNGNLSLGVKYSAIDTDKIKQIRDILDKVQIKGIGKDDTYFYFTQNSQQRVFRRTASINKENYVALKNQFSELAAKLSQIKIYGYIDVYIVNIYGFHKIILDVHPLAIPSDKVNELVLGLLDMDETAYQNAVTEADRIIKERNEKYELEKKEREEKLKLFAERRDKFLQPYKDMAGIAAGAELVKLSIGTIVVKFDITPEQDEFVFNNYVFYRIGPKGSFGKYKIQKAKSPVYDLNNLVWEEYKQMKLSEVSIKGYENKLPIGVSAPLINTIVRDETLSAKMAVKQETKTGVEVVEYSDSSIAVFGETYPIKTILSDAGGRFNYHLSRDGVKTPGWIFAKSKITIEKLKEKLGV